MASPRRDRYLELLEREPWRTRKELAVVVGVSAETVRTCWRRDHPDFAETERRVRLRYKESQKALKAAQRAAEGAERPALALVAPEAEALDPRLARWLAVYEACDDRIEACQKLSEEGIDLSWEEVGEALEQSKEFRARFQALWQRGVIQAEDKLRQAARRGKDAGLLKTYLAAELPKKYGAKVLVKHRHDVSVRLESGHRQLVEEQAGWVKRYRRRAALATQRAFEAQAGGDVVEGEVVQ